MFPIYSLGSVREIHSLGKYFSVHSLGHSEYQEIHTYSALNIDSVKINTSLLMMRECDIHIEISQYSDIIHSHIITREVLILTLSILLNL